MGWARTVFSWLTFVCTRRFRRMMSIKIKINKVSYRTQASAEYAEKSNCVRNWYSGNGDERNEWQSCAPWKGMLIAGRHVLLKLSVLFKQCTAEQTRTIKITPLGEHKKLVVLNVCLSRLPSLHCTVSGRICSRRFCKRYCAISRDSWPDIR